jgi:hypothetical protein
MEGPRRAGSGASKKIALLREYLRGYLEDKEDTSDAIAPLIGEESDVEEAWKYFTWMEALDWKFLPRAGGLEDQDSVLMDNIFQIKVSYNKLKK